MIAVFRMSSAKKEKMLRKLEKMEEFIEDFKECLEKSDDYDEDADYRDGEHGHDYEDEKEFRKLMNRYAKMKRMGMK